MFSDSPAIDQAHPSSLTKMTIMFECPAPACEGVRKTSSPARNVEIFASTSPSSGDAAPRSLPSSAMPLPIKCELVQPYSCRPWSRTQERYMPNSRPPRWRKCQLGFDPPSRDFCHGEVRSKPVIRHPADVAPFHTPPVLTSLTTYWPLPVWLDYRD